MGPIGGGESERQLSRSQICFRRMRGPRSVSATGFHLALNLIGVTSASFDAPANGWPLPPKFH
jgi:hypothetical protein